MDSRFPVETDLTGDLPVPYHRGQASTSGPVRLMSSPLDARVSRVRAATQTREVVLRRPTGPHSDDADQVLPAALTQGDQPVDDALRALARAHGVATDYTDADQKHHQISASTVVAVLQALGVQVDSQGEGDPAQRREQERWTRTVAPCVVKRNTDEVDLAVYTDAAQGATITISTEEGDVLPLAILTPDVAAAEVDLAATERGQRRRWRVPLPADLPFGYHHVDVLVEGAQKPERCALVVVPEAVPTHPGLARKRAGVTAQLYSVRSHQSWGLGDIADLNELVGWAAREHDADFVLINPIHAGSVTVPIEPSPYLPSSRRFRDPLYIRVEEVPEVAYMPSTDRSLVQWRSEELRALNHRNLELDRASVWEAKRASLEEVHAVPRSPARQAAFEDFCRAGGEDLAAYTAWCAFTERFGPNTSTWPLSTRDRGPEGQNLRASLADRMTFYAWLQWVLDEQCELAQANAKKCGMAYGIIHDLAIGVHPHGADVWQKGHMLALGMSVGAPPDSYCPLGQSWGQPPWSPKALAEDGYRTFAAGLRATMRHSGGIRIDHVMGMFRQWWVPDGSDATQGTYVLYDHEAMVGVLCLEAMRAGAVVIGEDLGTVEPWVRDYLSERGILGTNVVWFEFDEKGQPRDPRQWRPGALATITTHDLPPTAGYLSGEYQETRKDLGLLTQAHAKASEREAQGREVLLSAVKDSGLMDPGPTERQVVEALYRWVARGQCQLLGVALTDAVGERRSQNEPGTLETQYPNWKVPLGDGEGQPVFIEDLWSRPRAQSLMTAVRDVLDPSSENAARPTPAE